jgi:hypothetical protein
MRGSRSAPVHPGNRLNKARETGPHQTNFHSGTGDPESLYHHRRRTSIDILIDCPRFVHSHVHLPTQNLQIRVSTIAPGWLNGHPPRVFLTRRYQPYLQPTSPRIGLRWPAIDGPWREGFGEKRAGAGGCGTGGPKATCRHRRTLARSRPAGRWLRIPWIGTDPILNEDGSCGGSAESSSTKAPIGVHDPPRTAAAGTG